jgi:tetratricopeptide (TPR) repeat protein
VGLTIATIVLFLLPLIPGCWVANMPAQVDMPKAVSTNGIPATSPSTHSATNNSSSPSTNAPGHESSPVHGWHAFGVIVIAAFGSFACGALGGFLFGLPKTQQQKGSEIQDNTNLEQVSDWLVKILIGAGLVQMIKVKDTLILAARSLAGCIPFNCIPFAVFLIVYYSILGFLAVFLMTKIGLPQILKDAFDNLKDEIRDEVETQVEETQAKFEKRLDYKKVVDEAIAAMNTPTGDPARKSNLKQAEKRLDRIIEEDETYPYAPHVKAMILRRLGDLPAAIMTLKKAIEVRSPLREQGDADLRYNLACYLNVTAANLEPYDPRKKELEFEAWTMLADACEIEPDAVAVAEEDEDLTKLIERKQQEWKSLKEKLLK